jgi:hypothetical protein
VQLFQEEARTPAPAARQEQHSTASPAAQAILSAISGGTKAPAQQQQQQVRAAHASSYPYVQLLGTWVCLAVCRIGTSWCLQQTHLA